MPTRKISVTDKSVERAGAPRDYICAIIEYIRNGFDAGATRIDVNYAVNKLKSLDNLFIRDNGSGIDFDSLALSFGHLLDSPKLYRKTAFTHGSKGKGRFAFQKLGTGAIWRTIYKEAKDEKKEYEIKISGANKDELSYTDPVKSKSKVTGTEVKILNPSVTEADLNKEEFYEQLRIEFSRFLYLNKEESYGIYINGTPLEYESLFRKTPTNHLIKASVLDEKKKEISAEFEATIIIWKSRIGEYSSYYYRNSDDFAIDEKTTLFNNKKDDFYHSVYVKSALFDKPGVINTNDSDFAGLFTNGENKLFKKFEQSISEILESERKDFLRHNTEKIIKTYEDEGVFPDFDESSLEGKFKKQQFKDFVKEVYVITPRLFESLNEPQKVTLFGMMGALIDSEKKDDLIYIIERVIELSEDDLKRLRNILTTSSLPAIISTIETIKNRYKTVEGLKKIVFELTKFTTEREHIQKIMEKNYRLIDEGFERLTADNNFKVLYEKRLECIGEEDESTIGKSSERKRPDIFMTNYRLNPNPNNPSTLRKESIIVELKRPSVEIGMTQYNQIQKYMNIIANMPENTTSLVDWKFYIIGNALDQFVESKRKACADRGEELFLADRIANYKIYALTRADLFLVFEGKHKYLLEKLEIQHEKITNELQTSEKGKKAVDVIAKKIK